MPTQPPSDRTRAKGGHSSPEFCPGAPGLTSGFSPDMQNKPNLPLLQPCPRSKKCETNPIPARATTKYAKRTLKETQAAGLPPLYLTPTEVGATANTQKMQNKPNFHPAHDPKRETNPISTQLTPQNAKRTQSHPPPSCLIPHFAKRTQIYLATSIAPPPFQRNEPNLRTIYAKRTQFTVPPPANHAGRRSVPARRETQFAPLEGTRTLNLRIDRPNVDDGKYLNSNDLQQNEKDAYKPAYKDNRNTLSLDGTPLPNELSEIILCWSELPEHVKQAIHALTRGSK